MIQHVRVDHITHDTVTEAARAAGLAYDSMLEWIICDWAQTHRGRQQARAEFVQALEDAYGVQPGGD